MTELYMQVGWGKERRADWAWIGGGNAYESLNTTFVPCLTNHVHSRL